MSLVFHRSAQTHSSQVRGCVKLDVIHDTSRFPVDIKHANAVFETMSLISKIISVPETNFALYLRRGGLDHPNTQVVGARTWKYYNIDADDHLEVRVFGVKVLDSAALHLWLHTLVHS